MLKKKLRHFIPAAADDWAKQIERKNEIDKLVQTIAAHSSFYENDDLRIFPIQQQELWDEGYDAEEQEFTGARWGKYLRAPKIFFTILEKGKEKLIPLNEIAGIKRGFTTGANEFFYLTEKEINTRGIEKEFWMHKDEKGKWIQNYLIKSPRECEGIVVRPELLKLRVLMIHKERKKLQGTKMLQYILAGERKKFHKLDTLVARQLSYENWKNKKSLKKKPTYFGWYDLGEWMKPDLIWSDAYNTRYAVFDAANIWADKRFFYVTLNDKENIPLITAFLNSTLTTLFIDIDGITNLGEGAVYTNVYQLKKLRVPGTKRIGQKKLSEVLEKLKMRPIDSIFAEVGAHIAQEVSLSKVKSDRRELDKIIMGDILGLTEEEQLEVYRTVIDLVKSRIEKAQSVDKINKIVEGMDLTLLAKHSVKRIKHKRK